MVKRFRNIIIWSFALFILVLSAAIGLGYVYEDDVKAALTGKLNEQLRTPVNFSSMELSLLRQFPNASLHLTDVLAMEAIPDKVFPDTLLYVKDLDLEIGLWGLLSGRYQVKELHVRHVRFHPAIDAAGEVNYQFWKASDSTATKAFIDLDHIHLRDLFLTYRDEQSDFAMALRSDRTDLSGQFGDALDRIAINGELRIERMQRKGTLLMEDLHAQLNLTIELPDDAGSMRVRDGELIANGSDLNVSFDLGPAGPERPMDLHITGNELDLGLLATLFPEKGNALLEHYGMGGTADVDANYTGTMSASSSPTLALSVQLHSGRMKERRSGAVFKAINGRAELALDEQGNITMLNIHELSATSGPGRLMGSLEMRGVKPAQVSLQLTSNVDLADLIRFTGLDTLEQVAGKMDVKVDLSGPISDLTDLRAQDFNRLKITGRAEIQNGALKLKGLRHRVTGLNGIFLLDGKDAALPRLEADIQGDHVVLEGFLRNLVPYLLFDGQVLTVESRLHAPHIDLAQWISTSEAGSTGEMELSLPRLLSLDLNVDVDAISFNAFEATQVSGSVRVRDGQLNADPISLHTAKGKMLAKLALDARSKGAYPMRVNASFEGIDVSEFFREFADFGQDFMTHAHLKGTAAAQVSLSTTLSPSMSLNTDALRSIIDIRIDNGEIIEHGPMIEVAEHIRKNRLIAPFVKVNELEQKLHHIRFDRLENQIEIRDRTIFLPSMEVKSDLMNITISGTHTFDDVMDHHMNFRLAEIMRVARSNDEFGPVMDDGTGMRIFLHMYGPVDDLQFGNDKAAMAEARKQTMKNAKEDLRDLLREELGLFKKDTSITKPRNDQQGPRFEVEWDANDSLPNSKSKEKKKSGVGRFLDKLVSEEEPEPTIEVVP